jgi:hypothetical protein
MARLALSRLAQLGIALQMFSQAEAQALTIGGLPASEVVQNTNQAVKNANTIANGLAAGGLDGTLSGGIPQANQDALNNAAGTLLAGVSG